MTPEERRIYSARYRRENRAKIQAYREANKERIADYQRAYNKANKAAKDEYRKGYVERNRDHLRAARKVYNAANAQVRKARHLLARYGLTPDGFAWLWAVQGGKCALCSCELQALPEKGRHVDHCHVTGVVRGLLCTVCNTRLGVLEGRGAAGLARDFEYLRRHKLHVDSSGGKNTG